ncbi:MAG TPA: glycosyltransferase family 39 protein [Chthoniobacterales bacterium]|nr:glycosyltransferase family 39 protein [Chthoniobacterales bacterium]
MSSVISAVKSHWPMLFVAGLGAVLIFTNLGSDYLWEDEGDTAAFAVNIQKFGVPRAWDGVTFIDSDGGAPLNDNLTLISHPLLQYYLTAASFAVFGQNNWAARLPFALAGWLTIVIAYLCGFDLTRNRWAAFCSAILLTASVQFLLYCRQCRYYALSMLLSTLLVWIFFNLRSIQSALLFAIVAVFLFHSHPFGIVFVGVLLLAGFVYRHGGSVNGGGGSRRHGLSPKGGASGCERINRRYLAFGGLIAAVFVLPWIAFVRSGYAVHSEPVNSITQFFGRFAQYAVESTSVTPLIGIVILSAVVGVLGKRRVEQQEPLLDRRQLGFLLVTLVTVICYAVAGAISESSDDIWRVGLRYSTALLPLTAIAAGMLIVRVSRGRIAIWVPLLLIFAFTKFAQLTPWIFWVEKQATLDGKEIVRAHPALDNVPRYLAIPEQWAFVQDLGTENSGTLAKACEFFKANANANDLVLTNYDWQPLYFYTRLPQSLRIFPDYPIYQAAKRKGLPEYVFNIDGVRWIFWRPVWDGLWGYVGSDLQRDMRSRGARITPIAQFPETIFENRPEIHYHRFSGGRYFYIALDNSSTAQVFRVDWPGVLRSDR